MRRCPRFSGPAPASPDTWHTIPRCRYPLQNHRMGYPSFSLQSPKCPAEIRELNVLVCASKAPSRGFQYGTGVSRKDQGPFSGEENSGWPPLEGAVTTVARSFLCSYCHARKFPVDFPRAWKIVCKGCGTLSVPFSTRRVCAARFQGLSDTCGAELLTFTRPGLAHRFGVGGGGGLDLPILIVA